MSEFASHYGWHNAALIRVDELAKEFVLEADQCPPDGFRLPTGWRQSLDNGLLGHCRRTGRAFHVNDVKVDPDFAGIYLESNGNTLSEMCVPLWIGNRIRWIVNFEDRRRFRH